MNEVGTQSDLESFRVKAEDVVRESPTQATVAALVAGFALALLPIGSIILGIVRLSLSLAFALVKPALLVFGAIKIYEECCARWQEGEDSSNF